MNRLLALAAAAPVALLAGAALAQTPAAPPAEVLRFEAPQRAIAVTLPNEAECLATLPSPGATPTGRVMVEGATLLTEADRQTLAMRLTPEGAPKVAAWLDCHYASLGYVGARSSITLDGGVWNVRVREGRVTGLDVQGANASQEAFIRRAFSDVRVGTVLNARDLKRGADAAARYGFWGVTPSVAPDGEGVVLVLNVSPGPPGLFLSAQNASAPTVGTWSGGASLIFGGLTPVHERTIIGLFHDLTGDAQRGAQISSQALLTGSGLEVKGDLAIFQQSPDERPPNLDTDGTTRVGRIELRHPLGLAGGGGATVLFAGRLGLEAVDQDTDLTTGPATVRDSLRVIYAGVQADYRGPGATAYGYLSLRQGLDGLGASQAGDPLLSRVQADPQALVLRFEGQASITSGGFLIEPRLRVQVADKPLLQYEEFTYGGLIGGRALDPGALYGDSGVSGSIDVYGPAARLGPRLAIRPAAFVEGAWARNEDTIGPDRMSGTFAGGGLRFSLDGRWNLDLLYAAPLGDTVGVPAQFVGPKVSVGVSGGISF
ncbi:MAG: ShlB/FhaC/HecB family hemolysin secretion/activation protein [Caulobacter sp.]|nr:ShlB/FhaC/HecB family hemolysin secretion/activation protein [Caulobacter sp.]